MSGATYKNEWLEVEDNVISDAGYDSETPKESRGAVVGRSAKRRRLSHESDDDEDSEDDRFVTALEIGDDEDDGAEPNDTKAAEPRKPSKNSLVPLTTKQFEASQKAVKKTGVIYLSRIPPFMKPQALKHHFQSYGPINRVFLTPEEGPARSQRLRNGGNKKTLYLDGWVEFLSKRDAKLVVDALSGNIVGGKKSGYYHDDIWNIKYLKGFKWHHLTEQISNENAERAARLRTEIARTRRENREFVRDVEQGKVMETRKAKRAKRNTDASRVNQDKEPARKFRQNAAVKEQKEEAAQPSATARVLSKLF